MENKGTKLYRVYGMLLEIRDTFFLSIQYATSLEEAFNQAKLEFHRLNPPVAGTDNSLLGAKIGLFTIKEVDALVHENKVFKERQLERIALKHKKVEQQEEKVKIESKKPVEVKKMQLDPGDVKNLIMKEIVTKKDKKLLELHKALFNTYETQYLVDEIEKKPKS